MKIPSIAAVFLLTLVSSHARNLFAPDRQFAIRAEKDIQVIDASGNPVLTLVKDTTGDTKVEVQWSPDSQRVVVVETQNRSSDIVAAWREGTIWHRTIELDSDHGDLLNAAQRQFGRLVSEKRTLGSWLSEEALQVHGELTFIGGRKCPFSYTLEFVHGPIRLSRGGYEDGALTGKDFVLR